MMSFFYLVPVAVGLVFFWVRECRRVSPLSQAILFFVLLPMVLVPVWEIESFGCLNWNERSSHELKLFLSNSSGDLKERAAGDSKAWLKDLKEEALKVPWREPGDSSGRIPPAWLVASLLGAGLLLMALTLLPAKGNTPMRSLWTGIACVVCLSVFLATLSKRTQEGRYSKLIVSWKSQIASESEALLLRGDSMAAVAARMEACAKGLSVGYERELRMEPVLKALREGQGVQDVPKGAL